MIAAVIGGPNPTQGDYDGLPLEITQYYTPLQWSWLSDAQKANIVRDEMEPEC